MYGLSEEAYTLIRTFHENLSLCVANKDAEYFNHEDYNWQLVNYFVTRYNCVGENYTDFTAETVTPKDMLTRVSNVLYPKWTNLSDFGHCAPMSLDEINQELHWMANYTHDIICHCGNDVQLSITNNEVRCIYCNCVHTMEFDDFGYISHNDTDCTEKDVDEYSYQCHCGVYVYYSANIETSVTCDGCGCEYYVANSTINLDTPCPDFDDDTGDGDYSECPNCGEYTMYGDVCENCGYDKNNNPSTCPACNNEYYGSSCDYGCTLLTCSFCNASVWLPYGDWEDPEAKNYWYEYHGQGYCTWA